MTVLVNKSILLSTKKNLGIAEDYTVFDPDLVMHINTALATLNQLGIGPAEGFAIEDATEEWESFLGTDLRLNSAKTYVYLKVRSLFDPPNTGYHLTAMKEQLTELEWRLNVVREEESWVDPNPPPLLEDELL